MSDINASSFICLIIEKGETRTFLLVTGRIVAVHVVDFIRVASDIIFIIAACPEA